MEAASADTRKRMAATRGRDNPREVQIRSTLHRMGRRFRTHHRVIEGSKRTVDIAFTRAKVAVFLDGCFWHGCPIHGTLPKANSDWWAIKLLNNQARDLDTDAAMDVQGWRVVRVWEHVPLSQAVTLIEEAVLAAY